MELSQFPKKEICHHQEINIQFLFSHSKVSWKGTFTALFLTTCMCTIQFLTGNGPSLMVSQPLLPYCLVSFSHDCLQSFNNKTEICSVFFNISKAFDSVPHALLLQKLSAINVNPHIIKWIQSYLSCR